MKFFARKLQMKKKSFDENHQIVNEYKIMNMLHCTNVIFSIQYVDECCNLEHYYTVL